MSAVLTPLEVNAPSLNGSSPALTPMPSPLADLPLQARLAGLHRISGADYDRMTALGILGPQHKIELINGYMVNKMARDAAHDGNLTALDETIAELGLKGWVRRSQMALVLRENRPEPDYVIARGNRHTYLQQHPTPQDVALVVEVANSTLAVDRTDKLSLYAENQIPVYWIVNTASRTVEVYESPVGATYQKQTDYKPGDTVPLILDGQTFSIAVADILPSELQSQ
jgi:Uma2 family endonuclease